MHHRALCVAAVAPLALLCVSSAHAQVTWSRLPFSNSGVAPRTILATSDAGRVYGIIQAPSPTPGASFAWSSSEGELPLAIPGASSFSLRSTSGGGEVLVGVATFPGGARLVRYHVSTATTQFLGQPGEVFGAIDASHDASVVSAVLPAQFSGESARLFWWDAAGVRQEFVTPVGVDQRLEYHGPAVNPQGSRIAFTRSIITQPPQSFAQWDTRTLILDPATAQATPACLSSQDDSLVTTALRPDNVLYAAQGAAPFQTSLACGDATSFVVRSMSSDGGVLVGDAKFRDRAGVEHDIATYLVAFGVTDAAGWTLRDAGSMSPNGRYFTVQGTRFEPTYDTATFLVDLGPIDPVCDSIDFNNDTLLPDSGDLDDFLAVLSGGPTACSNFPLCNDLDFNNDTLTPDSRDLEDFLVALSGGGCPG